MRRIRLSGIATRSACGVIMLAGVSSLANADVTMEERTSVEGLGMMRMANMSGTSVTTIAGDRARIESDLQMQSRIARVLTRGMGPTADIIRLSEGKAYELDLKKKEYAETSFAERRAQMQAALEQSSKARPPVGGVDEDQCEWSNPKTSVERSGEKAIIAGNEAERVRITATQACADKKSGAVCEFGLLLDQWIAPKLAGGDEAQKFFAAYAQKLGFDGALSKEGAQRAEAMFGRYKGMWSEIATKMRGITGYPIKSTFALAVGGPQCQGAQSTGATAPSGGGGIAGRIAGSILNRKKADQDTSTPPPQVNGMVPLLTVSSELLSVKADPAAPEVFEVPSGFRQVQR